MTGGDILIECLKAQGVRCVFGMPGTTEHTDLRLAPSSWSRRYRSLSCPS